MKDKSRRTETGKMLLDVSKYFATVTGIGTIATSQPTNWRILIIGIAMALISWFIGVNAIPEDEEEKK